MQKDMYTCASTHLAAACMGFQPWSAGPLLWSLRHWTSEILNENEVSFAVTFKKHACFKLEHGLVNMKITDTSNTVTQNVEHTLWFFRKPSRCLKSFFRRLLSLRTVVMIMTSRSCPWNSSVDPTVTPSIPRFARSALIFNTCKQQNKCSGCPHNPFVLSK